MPIIIEPKSSVALSHLDLRRKIYQAIPMLGVPALLRISTLIESFKPVPETPMNEQVAGNHYKSEFIQPGELAEINNLSAWQFSIYKYITRFRKKKGAEDLKKAIHCVEHLLWSEYGVCDEWASGSGVKTEDYNNPSSAVIYKTGHQISFRLKSFGQSSPKKYEFFRNTFNAEKRQAELRRDTEAYDVEMKIFDYQISEGEQYHWQDGAREGDRPWPEGRPVLEATFKELTEQRVAIMRKTLDNCIFQANAKCCPGCSVLYDDFKALFDQLDKMV